MEHSAVQKKQKKQKGTRMRKSSRKTDRLAIYYWYNTCKHMPKWIVKQVFLEQQTSCCTPPTIGLIGLIVCFLKWMKMSSLSSPKGGRFGVPGNGTPDFLGVALLCKGTDQGGVAVLVESFRHLELMTTKLFCPKLGYKSTVIQQNSLTASYWGIQRKHVLAI